MPEKYNDPRESYSSDDIFLSYLQDFKDDYYNYTGHSIDLNDVPVHFSNSIKKRKNKHGLPPLGLCRSWNGGSKVEILINEAQWNTLVESAKKLLVYHELGHCVLKRGHRSDRSSTGAKMSIMHPYLVWYRNFERYEDLYLRELFLKEDW